MYTLDWNFIYTQLLRRIWYSFLLIVKARACFSWAVLCSGTLTRTSIVVVYALNKLINCPFSTLVSMRWFQVLRRRHVMNSCCISPSGYSWADNNLEHTLFVLCLEGSTLLYLMWWHFVLKYLTAGGISPRDGIGRARISCMTISLLDKMRIAIGRLSVHSIRNTHPSATPPKLLLRCGLLSWVQMRHDISFRQTHNLSIVPIFSQADQIS